MSATEGRVAQMFLRYLSPLGGLRRVPVLSAWARWASARILPRDAMAWVEVQHGPAKGLWLKLNPRTGRDYFQGVVEPEVQQTLAEHLRAGMTVYDIGANIGFFSLLAARLVGNEGRVVAFEADPEVAARLREHAARNGFSSIAVEEKAVWSRTGEVRFARSDPAASPDLGLGHIEMDGTAKNSIGVAAVSLDDYVKHASAPDFVKCDVEGAEVEVVRGAQRLLAGKRPVVLCELHSEENRRTLGEEFSRLGYDSRSCGANHILAIPR